MDAPPENKCSARGGNCQFAPHAKPHFDHGGSFYCLLHLPLEAERKRPDDFMDLLNHILSLKLLDLSEVQFPNTIGANLHVPKEQVILRHCVFGDVSLSIRHAVIASSEMRGSMTLSLSGNAEFQQVTFRSRTTISSEHAKLTRLRDVTFKGKVMLANPVGGAWAFNRVRLEAPLRLDHRIVGLPQQINFHRTRFTRKACVDSVEGNYRLWRTLFAKNSDRENEGLFYALEKRSHRKGLPWSSPTRWTSALYDYASLYGQSYERAFSWLLVVQATAFLRYGFKSGLVELGGDFDWQSFLRLTRFTVAQLAKPFELLAARGVGENRVMLDVIGRSDSADWALTTFAHSISSLILLALFVLALRWRFRRA